MMMGRLGRGTGPIVLVLVLALAACTPGAGSKNLTGAFVNWIPVDDANGYAYFTVTNHGTSAATAKCTVSVSDDFGDFGFDSLVGESVAMAIGMGKGSRLVNHGTVKNC